MSGKRRLLIQHACPRDAELQCKKSAIDIVQILCWRVQLRELVGQIVRLPSTCFYVLWKRSCSRCRIRFPFSCLVPCCPMRNSSSRLPRSTIGDRTESFALSSTSPITTGRSWDISGLGRTHRLVLCRNRGTVTAGLLFWNKTESDSPDCRNQKPFRGKFSRMIMLSELSAS